MTPLSVDRLWLILLAYSSVDPVAPVFLTDSDPARSTRYKVPVTFDCSISLYWTTVRRKQEWEREEWAFMSVLAIARAAVPLSMRSYTSETNLVNLH